MTQLILQNVTKRFHHAYAVDHVDLSVPDGKLVCFRPVRLRQDHADADHRRPRDADRRHADVRRPRPHARTRQPPRLRHGVPVARAVSA